MDKGCNCITCGRKVKDEDSSLQCEVCEGWCHAQCEKISEDVFQVLQRENIHWYCLTCNKSLGTILTTMKRILLNQEDTENELKEFDKCVTRMDTQLKENKNKLSILEADINSLKKEKEFYKKELKTAKDEMKSALCDIEKKREDDWPKLNEKKWADIASIQVEKKLYTVSSDLQTVQTAISEANEKESRRNNIIIYNVTERADGTVEDKHKEDKSFVLQLMTSLNTGVAEEDIKNIYRLGKKSDDGKFRPLLVQFNSRLAKNLAMDNLYRLKNIEARFKGVTISHDMTVKVKEREECRKLVEEAKGKAASDTSGEWL
jgi:hypothetical protein